MEPRVSNKDRSPWQHSKETMNHNYKTVGSEGCITDNSKRIDVYEIFVENLLKRLKRYVLNEEKVVTEHIKYLHNSY